jgi:putative photosynthetic complex assembly protein 2
VDSVGLAISFAAFVWWFSTGAILVLVRLPRAMHGAALAGSAVLAALSLWGLMATRDATTPAGALAGFTYGIVIWGFLETSFLLGHVTGPRRTPQSDGARGLRRFREAFDVLSHHELAILAMGILLIALTAGAGNQVGTWTFLCLWAMRISAKLNLFFGAPNVSVEFLPAHLSYLGSYFRRDGVSLFFPLSVSLASVAFGAVVHAAGGAVTPFETTALTLIGAMLGLAILEHWFLVLPLPDAQLWRWALRAGEPGAVPQARVAPRGTAAHESSPSSLAAVVLPHRRPMPDRRQP